LGLTLGVHF